MERSRKKTRIKGMVIVALALITTVIYSLWRIIFSMPWDLRFVDILFGLLLLVAELVGFWEASNSFNGFTKGYEPGCPVIPEEEYPHIDVFIATYNETEELLMKTVNGCLYMDYPDKSKVHIYLCDDNRRPEIEAFSKRMGVGYFKRDTNEGAKAGNLNYAMSQTSSPFVATFDADMIPMHDFLLALIPYFFLETYEQDKDGQWLKREIPDEDMKIGFVQSPQSFYNTDLFQYNLFSEKHVPNEQDYFFRNVQLARNASNAAIYAGSNTILSRRALDEVGGFYEKAITEDLATGLKIQTHGYKCFALGSVHANGLAPTDLPSLFKQRERWARGCIQTFRQMGIWRHKGLTWGQKREYTASLLYWYTSVRRLIFIMAPILFSLFHVQLLECSFMEILIFWLPHYIAYNVAIFTLTGKVRTSRLSNVYDTILFLHLIGGVLLETIGIKKEKFSVTKKEYSQESMGYRIKMAIPYFILIVLSIASMAVCIKNSFTGGIQAYLIILFWLIANTYSLIMAAFFIFGRKYLRRSERLTASLPMEIRYEDPERGEIWKKVYTNNISEGGAAFSLDKPEYIPEDIQIDLLLSYEDGRYESRLTGKVVYVVERKGKWNYSIQYEAVDEMEQRKLYQIIYDRKPSHPEQVDRRSGFYQDLKNNFIQRRKSRYGARRRLPRVELQRQVKVGKANKKVFLVDFNYKFMLLNDLPEKLGKKIELVLDEEKQIYIRGHLAESRKSVALGRGSLYKVDNLNELIYNEDFLNLLSDWKKELDDRKWNVYEIERKEKTSDLDSFDEMEYFRREKGQ